MIMVGHRYVNVFGLGLYSSTLVAQSCDDEGRPSCAKGSQPAPRVCGNGTFNGEKYLPAAIDSILSQTCGDFELIGIDDCSTDHTPNILRQIEDARMRVVRNERNPGISETLN
jgi:Glycosyl transferase family 2